MFTYRYGIENLPPVFQPFRFNGGALPLHLVETVHEWEEDCVDRIHDAQAWNSWLHAADQPVPDDSISDAGLEEMRALREAILLLARACMAGREVPTTPLDTVNRLAATPLPPTLLARGVEGLVAVRATPVTHSEVLAQIAREAVDLFSGAKAHRIRECAEPRCPTVFVDNSQSGTKMWCSSACGSRVAARAYRERRAARH